MSDVVCTRCVLPETFPGISFDHEGICNYCLTFANKHLDFEVIRTEAESAIRALIRNDNHYDVALAFSGGKDSCYTLKYLRDTFACRIIAITIDNGFISETARKNCISVTTNLGVDHIFFKPNPRAMISIYNKSLVEPIYDSGALKRASAVCNSCIQVINTQIVNFALNYRVPVVAGGYLAGQIPVESGLMKQNLLFTEKARSLTIDKLRRYLPAESLRLFAQDASTTKELTVVNPMAYLNLSEEQIIEEIEKIGWHKPVDTGASSTNCLLNDYAIHMHQQKHRFHPYVAEIAAMVRRGTITREDGLRKANAKVNQDNFLAIQKTLDSFK